jgi:hypothetical protein
LWENLPWIYQLFHYNAYPTGASRKGKKKGKGGGIRRPRGGRGIRRRRNFIPPKCFMGWGNFRDVCKSTRKENSSKLFSRIYKGGKWYGINF